MNKKFIILLTVLIDVLGIGIIIPVLPFYVESFGASAFIVTLLAAIFSLFSFFSAPLLGSLSDKIGRRPVLITSIISTAIGWLVFAAATNIYWLFIGRIIDGLAAGNFPIAQSYLVDISKDDKEKTSNLGLIGALFGIGFIIGPVIGGALSQISMTLPFWFVGGLATFNAILAFFNLPETNLTKDVNRKISFSPFTPIIKAVKNVNLRLSFVAWFLFGLAIAGQQAILSLYLVGAFNFNSFLISLVIGGTGIIVAINQGLLLKRVWLKHFTEDKLISGFLLMLSFSFLLTGIETLLFLIIGLFLFSVTHSVLRVSLTSKIAQEGNKNEQGMILGVLSSIMSLSMIIGPILAGGLFSVKLNLPLWASAGFSFIAFLIIIFEKNKKTKSEKVDENELEIMEQKIEVA